MDLIKELKNIKDGHWDENSFGAIDSVIKMLEEGFSFKGYVGRDQDGSLAVYSGEIKRDEDMWARDFSRNQIDFGFLHLSNDKFPKLKWEDEPLEVEITVRKV